MDASTLAASALAIANETSQSAAVQELLQERERLAMDREALRCFVVERHYIQAPRGVVDPIWTWKDAFECQADRLQQSRDNNLFMATMMRQNLGTMEETLHNMEVELEDTMSTSISLSELQTGAIAETRARNGRGGNGARSRSRRR